MNTNTARQDVNDGIKHESTIYGESAKQSLSGVIFRLSGSLLIVKKVHSVTNFGTNNSCVRGAITEFSVKSGINMRRFLRECSAKYTGFITLTYPMGYTRNGRESKEHLRRFLQELQRKAARDYPEQRSIFSAFWFMEFQERGAIHYHIFTNTFVSKEWLSTRWYEIVGSEDVRHLHAGTNVQSLLKGRAGTVSYAGKYASKQCQKVIPDDMKDCGRFWGVVGDRSRMSASMLLKHGVLQIPSVKKVFDEVITQVKRDVLAGRAKQLVRKDGVLVVNLFDGLAMSMARLGAARLRTAFAEIEMFECDFEERLDDDDGFACNKQEWDNLKTEGKMYKIPKPDKETGIYFE